MSNLRDTCSIVGLLYSDKYAIYRPSLLRLKRVDRPLGYYGSQPKASMNNVITHRYFCNVLYENFINNTISVYRSTVSMLDLILYLRSDIPTRRPGIRIGSLC